ncbi:D-threonate kinase [Necropsobacter massiliensis]|uniref:D-threonate kinase n=1 Tax=Necropsobacter massiliensis TaxID=1400001 RepID=UPI000595EEB1|nr:four-carbon acid sugar kinase family protein [Necropsobacter massiliensis]
MEILVIADDFTGANDTGVQFTHQGFSADVILNPENVYYGEADVAIINTDSRAMTIENAQKAITQAIQHHANVNTIYKKMDSTLRGNIGAELESCLRASQRKAAFVCTALPSAHRHINNGICYVGEQPLLETEFATDPKTPVISSTVKSIIAAQTRIPIVEIKLHQLRNTDCQPIIASSMAGHSPCIIAFDAERESDLARIAALIRPYHALAVIAGSAGLAKYILPKKRPHFLPPSALPMLFVAGSMSEITRRQIDYVKSHHDIASVDIAIERLLEEQDYIAFAAQQATDLLKRKQHVILKTENSADRRHHIEDLCRRFHLDRAQLGERICRQLSTLVKQILTQLNFQLSALFLTGGDIAVGAAKALGLKHYRILGEIENGVPYGYFPASSLAHIPVITKAGGLGSVSVLQNTLDFIRDLNKE